MRLQVNRSTCLRSGQCSYLHPELFREGKDRYPEVIVENPKGTEVSAARDAAEICPSQSIELVDEEE